MRGRHTAIMRSPRSRIAVHGRLRSVHGRATPMVASGRGRAVHGRARPTITGRARVRRDGSALRPAHNGNPRAIHRDGLARGMEFHSGRGFRGVFHDPDTGFVRALGDLDGLTDELAIATHRTTPSTPPSAATTPAAAHSSASISTATLRWMHGRGESRGHESRMGRSSTSSHA